MVRKPRSASVCAYSPDDCSFTAPNGPLTAMAGNLSATAIFGTYRSAASVMPKRLTKVTLLWSTLSLFGNVLSHSSVSFNFSIFLLFCMFCARLSIRPKKERKAAVKKIVRFITDWFFWLPMFSFHIAKLQEIIERIGRWITDVITSITENLAE